jgi:hypothetical protein
MINPAHFSLSVKVRKSLAPSSLADPKVRKNIENVEMPTENVVESEVTQNDEQGLVMSQDTVNDLSGKLDLLID